MSIAESLLAAVQVARLVNQLLREFQEGKLTEAEFTRKWDDIRHRLADVEERWADLERTDVDSSEDASSSA